ncbi:MAG: hypothetical protein CMG59_00875 [Candidatus Marinimicrobia bacterium]|nr:hypothetical protein [Candidatus Neomarinimicrobiota bacterium]|tara:strand:- start:3440 stop:3709 length:270 start_codon:yes stop_codon:yes gene_type:complete
MIKELDKEILKYINRNPKIKNYQKSEKIKKIIPKNLHRGIVEISIKSTQLIIKTKSPSWRQEISFLKKEIIKKIDKKVSNYGIKEIKVL